MRPDCTSYPCLSARPSTSRIYSSSVGWRPTHRGYETDGLKHRCRLMDFSRVFMHFSEKVAQASGRPTTFLLCVIAVIAWAVSGPFFGFSETWQLVINTGTTIVTFLMVFLIQNTQ